MHPDHETSPPLPQSENHGSGPARHPLPHSHTVHDPFPPVLVQPLQNRLPEIRVHVEQIRALEARTLQRRGRGAVGPRPQYRAQSGATARGAEGGYVHRGGITARGAQGVGEESAVAVRSDLLCPGSRLRLRFFGGVYGGFLVLGMEMEMTV